MTALSRAKHALTSRRRTAQANADMNAQLAKQLAEIQVVMQSTGAHAARVETGIETLHANFESLVRQLDLIIGDPRSVEGGQLATAEDILACFRLLLRRSPGATEWPGHSSHIGMPLDGVVNEFLTSLEFKQRHSTLVQPELEPLDIDGRTLFVFPDDVGISAMLRFGPYEPNVTEFVTSRLEPGFTFLDIGANLGHFTLLAAEAVQHGAVVAVEASSRNVGALRASVLANAYENVQILNVAASSTWQLLAFGMSGTNGITGSLATDDTTIDLVQGVPLDDALHLDRLDLVKIDVEGAEYQALSGLRSHLQRFRPTVVSEFAPLALEVVSGVSASTYLEFFFDLGYTASVIDVDGEPGIEANRPELVLKAYEESGVDHIDVAFEPARRHVPA
jgi:FkbM family methyltransferase